MALPYNIFCSNQILDGNFEYRNCLFRLEENVFNYREISLPHAGLHKRGSGNATFPVKREQKWIFRRNFKNVTETHLSQNKNWSIEILIQELVIDADIFRETEFEWGKTTPKFSYLSIKEKRRFRWSKSIFHL